MRSDLLLSSYAFFKSRTATFLIGAPWVIGLLVGGALPAVETTAFSSAATLHPSLFRVFTIRIIPFFLIAICSAFSLSFFSVGVIFSKALLHSYCSVGIIQAFASAGWLLRYLLLFSDLVAVVLLLWFSIRNINKKRGPLKFDLLLCVTIVLITCFIECRVISPFLITLLNS